MPAGKPKIVITGGLGFIGRNLGLYLRTRARQCQVHSVDWFDQAAPEDHQIFDRSLTTCFTSEAALELMADAEVVIHLAATTTVQESIADPARSFENNVTKTQILLEHLRHAAPGAHFIFASTGGAIIGPHDGPIHEGIPARPISPYGATKLAVEGLLHAYSGSYGMKATSVRFSNVYGPRSERKSSVVATYCKSALRSGSVQINGNGQQTRDYVFVEDVCQAIWKIIETGMTGPVQLGTGVATSILDLVDMLQKAMPANPLDVRHEPALPGEVPHNVCDITRARKALGYHPKFDLNRGLHETLGWFQEAAS